MVGENDKRNMEKRKMVEMHQQKVAQMIRVQEKCWSLAQNHEACSMERRSTDPEERRRGCEVVRPLCSKKERMGKALAV